MYLYQAIYSFPTQLGAEWNISHLAMAKGIHGYIMLEWILRYNPKLTQTHLNSQVGTRMEIFSQPLKWFYYLMGFACVRDATVFLFVITFPPPFLIEFITNYR